MDLCVGCKKRKSKLKMKRIKKRKPGISTGNAGEYFVMGELLRQGFDAQLADRNTKGYDLLVGHPEQTTLRKVQVKTKRVPPWYVRRADFKGKFRDIVTVYVLLGPLDSKKPIRFFVARNRKLAKYIYCPPRWPRNGIMPMKPLKQYEDRWNTVLR
jgi:hypothetical protein